MKLFFRKKDDDSNDFFDFQDESADSAEKVKFGSYTSPQALTPKELMSDKGDNATVASGVSPLEALKSRMLSTPGKSQDEKLTEEAVSVAHDKTTKSAASKSLLEKCHAYTVDDEGVDHSANTEPLYKLESVAEILRTNSEKTLKMLSEKYDVSIHDLKSGDMHSADENSASEPEGNTQPQKAVASDKKADPLPKKNDRPEPTAAFEKMVRDSEKATEEREIFEELFANVTTISEIETELPDISDIDNKVTQKAVDKPDISSTATIKFTPVKDIGNNAERISVSSITKPIDIGSEFEDISSGASVSASDTELEQSEFEEFCPENEPATPAQAKKLLREFAVKKRSHFLRCALSALFTFIISLFFVPPLSYTLVQSTETAMIVCVSFFAAGMVANFDMFADFKKLFTKRCDSGVTAAIASLFVLAFGIISVIEKNNGHPILFCGMLILLFRAFSAFCDISAKHGNLKQITTAKPKKAVTLIDDTAVTYAMAKKSIEGDALIASPKRAEFIGDFLKYSDFSAKLGGKLSLLNYAVLLIAIITGLVSFSYFDSWYYALYCAAAVMCISAMPSLFLIDSLPIFSAASRLNKKGSMIAGKAAAQKLEQANAVVISSTDLFPDGTVTLQSMKVLSDNDIDSTILRAASLTEAVGSTLSPIFKKIAGTNSSYSLPDPDTVKYEERLGLSGWVDNELLFIGNRTLMEAHGIEVPSVEFDRRILRKGYFPVYLASGGKACALIVIQYDVDPDVSKEMRRLTELGVTVLVNNTDPNINESMVCDYLGLYEDSVKIMSNAGVHMHKNATIPAQNCSAPAAFRGRNMHFISIMNCASRIKSSNLLLTASFVILSVLGVLLFIYSAFSGVASLPAASTVVLYCIASTVVSIILFLIKKP